MTAAPRSSQSGSTAVEFALVMLLFLTFLLAVTDFGRMLYTWNAAAEATRAGARYAAVCDAAGANRAQVLAKMQYLMPQLTDANLGLEWENETGGSCTPSDCMGVTVTVKDMKYRWISPIAGAAALPPFSMPTFKTFLTREIMRQDPNSPTIC